MTDEWKYPFTREQFVAAWEQGENITQVVRALGLKPGGVNHRLAHLAEELGLAPKAKGRRSSRCPYCGQERA